MRRSNGRQIHSCHSPLPESAAQSRGENEKEENENEKGKRQEKHEGLVDFPSRCVRLPFTEEIFTKPEDREQLLHKFLTTWLGTLRRAVLPDTPKCSAVTAGGSHNLSKSQYLLNSFSFSMDLPSQPMTSPIRNTITSAAPHCYCFVSCREGPRQPSLHRPLRSLG